MCAGGAYLLRAGSIFLQQSRNLNDFGTAGRVTHNCAWIGVWPWYLLGVIFRRRSTLVTQSKIQSPSIVTGPERAIESPELIDRLAHELRASSDASLPHSYFVEQVKLGLAGHTTHASGGANDAAPAPVRKMAASDCGASIFQSWALPE